MKIAELIKRTRKLAGESQAVFGQRWGVTESAISLWENNSREAPYKVIEFCLESIDVTQIIKGRVDSFIAELTELRKLLTK